ncbi:hypothetical protein MHZ36_10745 [Staphylococcus sp. ACRSN]|uniref:hypothetical protein n=1 Tax=Staphylococcus sp. ACRSN TaxID=2918214 RepID=UPI001EF29094|nr:hypothetical protein [Staphylococcus sp. ACRSN]MCG7339771.1 hypothetical protein [Staphylococcus sp. ACRSN]
MKNQNDEQRRKQLKFERNFINIPFLGFALVIAILNLSFPDINIMMTLFGLFFLYNGGILFVSFIKHYKRTTILSLFLTILTLALFGLSLYLYATANNLI